MTRYGEERVRQMMQILSDKKAQDVVAIHVADQTIVADWFIVASGRVVQQVKALCDEIQEKTGALGMSPLRVEGYQQGRWIVLDYGDILVHLFHHEERAYYNMERLWDDGGNVILQKEIEEDAHRE